MNAWIFVPLFVLTIMVLTTLIMGFFFLVSEMLRRFL